MKSNSHRLFPLFTDISKWEILVVGAGNIATRRIGTLMEFQGEITVVAEEVAPQISQWNQEKKIQLIRRQYKEEDLKNKKMVLAATNNEKLNEQIAQECHKRKILVNVSSNQQLCDFHFPGIVVKDEMTIGINGSGINHKKTGQVCRKIKETLDE